MDWCAFTAVIVRIFLTTQAKAPPPQSITIGLIRAIHEDVKDEEMAVEFAAHKVKEKGWLPNTEIKFVSTFGKSNTINPVGKFVELHQTQRIVGLLGPAGSDGMRPVAQLAGYWNLPVLAHAVTDEDLSNRVLYPTFGRVTPINKREQALATCQFLNHFTWNRIALIYSTTSRAARTFTAKQEIEIVLDIGMKTYDGALEAKESDFAEEVRTVLWEVKKTARNARNFLLLARKENMTGGDMVYFIIQRRPGPVPWNIRDGRDEEAKLAFKQSLAFMTSGEDIDEVETFIHEFSNATDYKPPSVWKWNNSPLLMAYLIDGVYLYAKAFNKCFTAPSCDYQNGTAVHEMMKHEEFQGEDGLVVIDSKAERYPEFEISGFGPNSERYTKYYYMKAEKSQHKFHRFIEIVKSFPWIEGAPPLAVPQCGFRNEHCKDTQGMSTQTMVLLCVIAIAVVLGTIVLVFHVRKQQFERDVLSRAWQIDWSELTIIETPIIIASAQFHGSSAGPVSKLSFYSLTSNFAMETPLGGEGHGETSTKEAAAMYQGYKVLIQIAKKKDELTIKKRDDLLLLKTLKDLQHENLNPFLGLCQNAQPFAIAQVWNLCSKGSLAGILYNDEIHLDMTFKASIMKDLINGLTHIHNSGIWAHGQLTVYNCLVDSRWSVKLSDFGVNMVLKNFRQQDVLAKYDTDTPEKLYHIAPEVLQRMKFGNFGSVDDVEPDQEADIYSLGMVFYQVLFREMPYEDLDEIHTEILAKLTDSAADGSFRPKIDPKKSTGIHQDLVAITQSCWNQTPHFRPTLKRIRNIVTRVTSQYSRNIVDHMMNLMEKYANNLEQMVQTRTKQLKEERQRADELLARMLPKSVAEKLKNGISVSPESFECATLYFSDIVGFTNICSSSSPIEVVEMLNQLYSIFDDIIAQHDAYKVETIGDSYLVASGVPNRNGFDHALQMASLAHRTLRVLRLYNVPHMTSRSIEARIGLHSGPVAAGVVGLTMPRYCLFGDTVNFASRMESSGKPMRVQVSLATKELLDEFGGGKYRSTFRGEMDIKGKGMCKTYWLEEFLR